MNKGSVLPPRSVESDCFQSVRILSYQIRYVLDVREFLRRTWWHSQERIDVFARVLPALAPLCQKILEDAVFASIGRILDPPTIGSSRSLSFEAYLNKTDNRLDSDVRDRLREELAKLRSEFSNLLQVRHKAVAHLDHDVAHQHATPLYSWGQIYALTDQLAQMMNESQDVFAFRSNFRLDEFSVGLDLESLVTMLARTEPPTACPPFTKHEYLPEC